MDNKISLATLDRKQNEKRLFNGFLEGFHSRSGYLWGHLPLHRVNEVNRKF